MLKKIGKIYLLFAVVIFGFSMSIAIAKPKIAILATGGTIAGAAADKTATGGYKAGEIGIQTLINAVPEAKRVANLTGEQIVSIDSQDMNPAIWLRLANKINKLLSSGTDGVIVTHGTDTLEETAYFLNLTVKSKKPVVIVGSMRPATAISADGPLNLYNAVKIAASKNSRGRGVLVAMNDTIYTARNVTKTNTTRVETFKDPFLGPIGVIQNGRIYYYYSSLRKHTTSSIFNVASVKQMPKVGILYAYAGIPAKETVNFFVKSGVKGIVVAGMGDGGLGTGLKAELSKAQKKGIVIVRSARVGTGIVTHNGDAADDKLHFVSADNLNPQKARVLLQLALTKTKSWKTIQRYYDQY